MNKLRVLNLGQLALSMNFRRICLTSWFINQIFLLILKNKRFYLSLNGGQVYKNNVITLFYRFSVF